jgi:hypothetical protein
VAETEAAPRPFQISSLRWAPTLRTSSGHWEQKQDRLDSGHSSDWKSAFDAAVHETNLAQLRKHVMSAEEAIYLRMQEQVNAPNDAELQAMQEAILVLREIQVTKLGYPDWKKK